MGDGKVEYRVVSTKEKEEEESKPIQAPEGFGCRHLQALILFLTLSISYGIRAHLSVTMVAMTGGLNTVKKCQCDLSNTSSIEVPLDEDGDVKMINVTNVDDLDELFSNKTSKCGTRETKNISSWTVRTTYNWDKATQDTIIYAFFVGYTTMMIPMGILAQKIGGKHPILFALGANGILSIVTPWVPMFGGWIGVCIVRVLNGMTQACLFPSIHTILAKWSPLSERGRLSAYIYTGSQFGTVLMFQIAGFFAGSPSFGWPAVFWVVGALNLCVFGLYWWFGASTPHEHKKISFEELKFITGELSGCKPKAGKTPWKQILTSKPVWGLMTSQIGSTMGYLLLYTQTPTYMSKVLGVDIKKNGVYSSLPYVSLYVTIIAVGYLTDFLINRKVMTVVNVRRMNNTMGMTVSGLLLVAFGFVQNTLIAIILLILCLTFHAGVNHGCHINQIDLAPNFAGSILALGNMISNLFSLLVPVIVVNIVQDDLSNQGRWQIVFLIMGTVQIITNMVFVVFAKATVQDWNDIDEEDDNVVMDKCSAIKNMSPTEDVLVQEKNKKMQT